MKYIFTILLFFFLGFAEYASAHVPNLVTQTSLQDIVLIEDPILSQAFYGELNNFPHTYEIRATEPFTLFTQILIPDIGTGKNNVSGIIIKLPEKRGRVTEVTRLLGGDASWDTEYEPFGGDTYRNGPTFTKELEAGTYRIEVHTPDNLEKYVLVVGTREEMTLGYFEMLRRIVGVKVFFDKSPVHVVESPFVYVPLLIILSGVSVWYWRRKKRASRDTASDILVENYDT